MKLYKFQEKILQETASLNKVAYYLDMGLGKTFVGAEKMYQLGEKTNLVICQKSKIQDWLDHFDSYYEIEVFDLTQSKQLNAFMKSESRRVGIINYDLIWRRTQLQELKDFTLMLDESSMIQNETTKRSKCILRMKAKNIILLSGTPVSGKYEKIWSQVQLLGWKISKRDFWDRYVVYWIMDIGTRFPIKIVDGYKNVNALKKNLHDYGAVFMKTEEVHELPEKRFIDIRVKKTKDYSKFAKTGILLRDGGDIIGDSTFAKMLGERVLSSEGKYKAFEDLILSTDDRLIVFYNFNSELEELKRIVERCGRKYSQVNGYKKDLVNYEEDDSSVTLIQYQAGAMGLNLQKASKVIYFSPTQSCDLYMQSIKRIHRIGQENSCTYYRLIMEDSIDEDIYKSLNKGEDYTNKLFEEREKRNDERRSVKSSE